MTDKERLKQMTEQLIDATPKKQLSLMPEPSDEELERTKMYDAIADDYYSIVGDYES